MRKLIPSLLIAALCTPAGAQAQDPGSRHSLEDLLRLARAERNTLLSELRSEVQALLEKMESPTTRARPEKAQDLRKTLKKMGPSVAPLLLPGLRPGPDPSRGQRFRAAQIVQVLRELRSPSIGAELLTSAQRGDAQGRINALRVLGTYPHPERIISGVRETFTGAKKEVKIAALLTLAQLRVPDLSDLLTEAFAQDEPDDIGKLLKGLAEIDRPAVQMCVAELVGSPRARALVTPLLEYYGTRGELLEEDEHLVPLIQLAGHAAMEASEAIQILDTLSRHDVTVKGTAKKALARLQESSQLNLRESALILLARSKDKGARRDLLGGYDERVKFSPASTSAYSERGEIYYMIAEYQRAIKDYKEAISLQKGLVPKGDAHIGIARCYARLKRYSDAEEYLAAAPVSMTTLRELAGDPAFEAMLETKYRRAFHLVE